MTRFAFKPPARFGSAAASLSLALVLSVSVSHEAMAVCSTAGSPPNTTCDSADDTVTISSGVQGAIDTDGGKDTITVTGGSEIKSINAGADDDTVTINTSNNTVFKTTGIRAYSVTTGLGNDHLIIRGGHFLGNVMGNGGNDTIEIYDGIFAGNVAGDGRASTDNDKDEDALGNSAQSSVTGNDTIKIYGGSIAGEVQGGNGNDTIYLYGGTINRVEGNASTDDRGDKIYLDGASLGSWEAPGSGAGGQELYMRSGKFGLLTGGGDDDDDDDDGPAGVNNLGALADHLIIDPVNTEQEHPQRLQIGVGFNFAGGNDSLTFIGAVNAGEDDDKNFIFTNSNIGFDGGAGTDALIVTGNAKGSSNVVLGEVKNFESLEVSKGSKLTLKDDEYAFTETVMVDGTSELHLSGTEVEFTTENFKLKSGAGLSGIAGLPSYYNAFATGGVLRIGFLPGAAADDDDDDDDDDVSPLADDDDDDGAPSGGPSKVTLFTGDDTYVNGGTIVMMNGVVGDQLIINDHYDSQNGNLAIDSTLGGSGSPTDNLTINGPMTGTTTTVYVKNVGGTGAFTGHGATDGIEIATNGNLAFQANSFKLATNALTGREEVLAGAFTYRLAVTNVAALLQSDVLDQVPAYVTAPSVGQKLVSSGLDTLYKRLGEIRNGQNDGATSGDGLVWVRGSFSDVDVDAKDGFGFSQRNNGVLAGTGGVIAGEAGSRLAVGAFGGYGKADADVAATIFGAASTSSIDATTWSIGGYATFYEVGRAGTGLYVDGVLKADFIDFDMASHSRAAHGSTDGDAFTASAEVGYGFGVGGGLVIQPQAQISYTDLSIANFKDAVPYKIGVSYQAAESLLGRLGLQVQTNIVTPGGGLISPYALVNVYSEFEGNNGSKIAGTAFNSDVSGTWYSAGGGVTARLANNINFYGSGEYHFGDVEGWQGTGGLKLNW